MCSVCRTKWGALKMTAIILQFVGIKEKKKLFTSNLSIFSPQTLIMLCET